MKTRERNLGIEMLRVLAMLGIVIQHILGHGWVVQSINSGTWKYDMVVALRSVCLFGISEFALISGYVGVKSRYRYSSIVLQWTKVWLYSVFFTALASILDPGAVGKGDWFGAMLPTLNKTFWYFTCYLGCFMFAPIINRGVKQLTGKQGAVMTVTMLYIFSMLSNALGGDAMYVNAGKGTLWLVIMYTVGAYFGHFQPHMRVSKAVLWVLAAVSMLIMAGLEPVAEKLRIDYLSKGPHNNSIQTVFMAVSMLLLFSRLEIRRGKKLISWLGSASFGVYVLHEHPFIRKYTITPHAYKLADLGNVEIIFGIVLSAAGLYLACALVDGLREKLYRALRVRQSLDALEKNLIGDLWAE